ncbi:MAG: hypothetical protein PHV82_10375, partial [Victivallaceae bacterium]|nr:hypothetical protein [Victivallaceae bacterium]
SRHLLFCTAGPGCAFIEMYRLTGKKKYLDASAKAVEWAIKHGTDITNNNYNSFAVWHLCEHYRETGHQDCLEDAIEKTVKGVYPNQQPGGGWPEHNSWIFYHGIILRGFAHLYGILPDGHICKTELRRRIIRALNCVIAAQQPDGSLKSCSDPEEWRLSREPASPYLIHNEKKICPFMIHALVCIQRFTDIDVSNILYGMLSAPPQDELAQGQEGAMQLAYGAVYHWFHDIAPGKGI